MESDMTQDKQITHSLPLLFVIIALIVWSAFQTTQFYKERQNLKTAYASQEQVVANAKKMRAQLDTIAAGTKRLADQGNANAQLIVQQLAKNGININPDAQATAAPK
jgi:Tfp pilus assembly protein PilO